MSEHRQSSVYFFDNNKEKIHNAHIVKQLIINRSRRQSPSGRRSMLIVNELGHEVRLEVALETVKVISDKIDCRLSSVSGMGVKCYPITGK